MSKRKATAVDEDEESDTAPDPIKADVLNRRCWLLRVPNDLAERWHVSQFRWGLYHEAKKKATLAPGNQRAQEEAVRKLKEATDSSILGRISIDSERADGKLEVPSKVPGQPVETYKMNLEVDAECVGQKAPREHLKILEEKTERDDEGSSTKLCVVSTVRKYWSVQESGKNWQNRNEAITSSRTTSNIVVEDEFEMGGKHANTFIRPLQEHEITAKRLAAVERRVLPEQRAERRSRDAVINELTELFNEERLWTTKDLRQRTNQPEQHLKNCLSELAVLHERGPNRGKWQLKEDLD